LAKANGNEVFIPFVAVPFMGRVTWTGV